ncbi:glycosyl hydrolase family 47 protein [Actinidia rufa]|uniref:alpha-1,2-Mannosidase n=1 Tax=Actinidia rufa TaxID=165716 RepID=A0A7J0DD22_9ERIC|nr:glycosyl hydrolase family 47 protein [Actinidia rufa]
MWFYHAYDNYMTYAFPHDELKPLTKTYTDSLVELGNLKLERLLQEYNGSALTLVESLSSLVIMGNNTEIERAVLWLSENLTFDVDARINLFECNIRVLEGLVSAHILATDSTNRLVQGNYKNLLLSLADDLGRRFLPAFDTPTGLPYAWINLKESTSPSGDVAVSDARNILDMAHGTVSTIYLPVQYGVFNPPLPLPLPPICSAINGQVLVGDITAANSSHREFFSVWEKFGVLSERGVIAGGSGRGDMLRVTDVWLDCQGSLEIFLFRGLGSCSGRGSFRSGLWLN